MYLQRYLICHLYKNSFIFDYGYSKTIIAQNTGVVYLLNDQGEEVLNYPSGQVVVHIGLTDADNPNDVHLPHKFTG